MKKLNILLSVAVMSFVMVGCGGGGSSSGESNNPPQNTPPPIAGSGTSDNPYIVGNGEFSFNGSAYFKILSTRSDCNVIAYSVSDLSPWGQTEMFDDAFVSISQEEGYVYNMASLKSYIIKANAYKDTAILGIYSTCIEQPNGSYNIETISNNSQNSFSVLRHSKLYKFNIPSDSTVTVKKIANTDYVYYYDSELNNIFTTYKDESIKLISGEYYVLVNKFGYGSEETPTFYFSVETN